MCSNGECFIVQPNNCSAGCLIVGRNSEDGESLDVAQEVFFYDAKEVLDESTDGGATAVASACAPLRIILQKSRPGIWGGDFGANERSVSVCLTWSAGESQCDEKILLGTDIVRLILASATNATDAVDHIGSLVTSHNNVTAKLNFVVCDARTAWIVSCAGRTWAAEKMEASYRRVPSGGLTVTDTIDKSSDGVDTTISYAAAHKAEAPLPMSDWCGAIPAGDASFTQQDMFETLRVASREGTSRAATVSVLTAAGISCHWFTATPNASESVFKPFVFAPNPRISKITSVQPESDVTLLYKLHGQRKPAALRHLRSLEASCVQELNNYFLLQDHPSDELDELLKDCVEAEVKFYR